MLIEGTTSSGVPFSVETRKINDYRFIRGFVRIAAASDSTEDFAEFSKSLVAFFDAIDSVVGVDFADEVALHNDGDASVNTVVKEVCDVLAAAQKADGEAKKA